MFLRMSTQGCIMELHNPKNQSEIKRVYYTQSSKSRQRRIQNLKMRVESIFPVPGTEFLASIQDQQK
jgi:hypothetical protein